MERCNYGIWAVPNASERRVLRSLMALLLLRFLSSFIRIKFGARSLENSFPGWMPFVIIVVNLSLKVFFLH